MDTQLSKVSSWAASWIICDRGVRVEYQDADAPVWIVWGNTANRVGSVWRDEANGHNNENRRTGAHLTP
jgi:hypothetical protein